MCPRPISSYRNKDLAVERIRKKGLLAFIDNVFAGLHRTMAVKSSCCHCCWEDYLLVVSAFERASQTDFVKGCIDRLIILLVASLISKVMVTK
jgi:hypothetical protein